MFQCRIGQCGICFLKLSGRIAAPSLGGGPLGSTMDALATKYYSDDGTRKSLSYYAEYERIIEDRRNQPLRILELGVFSGASMLIWSDYAPNATIVGLDSAKFPPAAISGEKRIHFVSGLQDDPATLDAAPLLAILIRSTKPFASGVNLKRSIQNTPLANISPGNLSRGKKTSGGMPRVSQRLVCRPNWERCPCCSPAPTQQFSYVLGEADIAENPTCKVAECRALALPALLRNPAGCAVALHRGTRSTLSPGFLCIASFLARRS